MASLICLLVIHIIRGKSLLLEYPLKKTEGLSKLHYLLHQIATAKSLELFSLPNWAVYTLNKKLYQ
jgi:hypothetical protein